MGITLRPDRFLLSGERPGLHTLRDTRKQTRSHAGEARYQSEMALKRLNERQKAEITIFFWQAVTVHVAEKEGLRNKVSILI